MTSSDNLAAEVLQPVLAVIRSRTRRTDEEGVFSPGACRAIAHLAHEAQVDLIREGPPSTTADLRLAQAFAGSLAAIAMNIERAEVGGSRERKCEIVADRYIHEEDLLALAEFVESHYGLGGAQ